MTNNIPVYQVDAFAKQIFTGNPAAVCFFDHFPSDVILQLIASEKNLSETAFLTPDIEGKTDFILRWFTPQTEVNLCGHATLAAAHIVFNHKSIKTDFVTFSTRSGVLGVQKLKDDQYRMNFPRLIASKVSCPDGMAEAIRRKPIEVYHKDNDFMLVYETQADIEDLHPDSDALGTFSPYGFVLTAPADDPEIDFVSRCFFPNQGIPEDPVTGSAHCMMAPYWAKRFGKLTMNAKQLSTRTGFLKVELGGDRVYLTGQAIEVMRGTFFVPS